MAITKLAPCGTGTNQGMVLVDGFNKLVDNNPLKIAVLGDSMSAQSVVYAHVWPTKFNDVLNQNGVRSEVRSFAVNAHSFFRLNTFPVYGSNTCVEELLGYQPDVVIVVCGHNDTINPVDGRTLEQVKSDANITFDALRSGLPLAEIYYGAQLAYDSSNFTPSTLKNKGAAPLYMERDSSGILTDLLTIEILDNPLGATKKTEYANWLSLDAEIKGVISVANAVDGSFDLDAWKVARLGFLTTDGLHSDSTGHALLAASVINGLLGVSAPFLTNLADQLIPAWNDLDVVFSEILTTSGDGYVPVTAIDMTEVTGLFSLVDHLQSESWYLPFKGVFNFFPLTLNAVTTFDGVFRWFIKGAEPNAVVENSVNGGAFTFATHSDGLVIMTNDNGDAEDANTVGALGLPSGVYVFRFKVGVVSFPPATITVN